VPIFIGRGAPLFLYFTALYARSGKNSSAGSFERVSDLEENRRRVLIAWQLTMSVESSPV
jgi:hypothetical protein